MFPSICSLRRLIVLASAIVPTLCGGATNGLSAQEPSPASTASLVLRPGDLVRIAVWRKPELSGDFLIGADSTLKHPLYREVRVAGLSAAAAREQIALYLRALESNPQVSIEPLVRVSVGGEVRNPNLYTLSPETSVSQAVALAGGPTERGRLDQVRLVRDGRLTMLDLSAPDATILATPVASGDQISLQRRSAVFRDYGLPAFNVLGGLAAVLGLFIGR